MISIGVFCPNQVDATSFYRGMGPLTALRREKRDIQLILMNTYNWVTLGLCDMVFMQRPYLTEHRQIAGMIKDLNIPLWVDYDDFLFAVPSDNPTSFVYGDQRHKQNVAEIIAMADAVTVSTQKLADLIQPLRTGGIPREPVIVVPNAFNTQQLGFMKKEPKPPHKLICWRGSNTHERDLMEFAEPIIKTAMRNPTWTWNFIGWNPWFITEKMNEKQFVVTPPLDIFQYHKFMADTAPDIVMVPLADHDFNRAKSNIAYIEGSFAGAACIAPDWEEWRRPGIMNYSAGQGETIQQGFERRLQQAMDLTAEPIWSVIVKNSWENIMRDLQINHVNMGRMGVIRKLLAPPVPMMSESA